MRILFVHPVFPGQFHRVMEALAAEPGNEVTHISRQAAMERVAGVRRLTFSVGKETAKGNPLASKFEEAVIQGQAVVRLVEALRAKGYRPDLIYGYAGWGQIMFMKDLFPNVPLAGYFEWYLHAFGAEYNFDPDYPLSGDQTLALRAANAATLLDLEACDHGVTPTRWQQHQFPAAFQSKLSVLHDGVDTALFRPRPGAGLSIPGLELPSGTPLVTYVTRGMEPFRGYPQVMRALALVQARHPTAHAVIVGTENIFYSKAPASGRSYKEELLAELSGRLDPARVHFTGWLDTPRYLAVLQASSAHVYLTRPYVLSWSLMEAMAAGCLVIGSMTPPVQEMIRDGDNGILVDFFDHEALADRLDAALADPQRFEAVRARARETIERRYALRDLVPRHAAMLKRWAGMPPPRPFDAAAAQREAP